MSLPEDKKESNPKAALGVQKSPHSTLSAVVIAEMGVGMLEGACKYGRHNWRDAGVRSSTYYDAAKRHLDAWWEGEDIDPDSGMPHILKVMTCLMVLRDAQILGLENDDRPPRATPGWRAELDEKTAEILKKYPEPVAAHVEKKAAELDDVTLTFNGTFDSEKDAFFGFCEGISATEMRVSWKEKKDK